MTINPNIKPVMTQIALKLMPPIIRNTLLEDKEFLKEHGLKTDALIEFTGLGVSFQRSKLYDSVRNLSSRTIEREITDTCGHRWIIRDLSNEKESFKLEISDSKQSFILPNLVGLSSNKHKRLCYIDEISSETNLPSNSREKWWKVLSERALEDDEVEMLQSEYDDTPVKWSDIMKKEIVNGNISISPLVPTSRRYYERLVGTFDGSRNIENYAEGSVKFFLEQLSTWRPFEGFLYSLLLSSHSAITANISVNKLSKEELIRAYKYLEKQGDRISQIGAIEVGLRFINTRPEIETYIIRLIEIIKDDNAEDHNSSFNLLSVLFFLVDGELSRIRLFPFEPPFYRRLAALSQAALIHRQLINFNIDIESFSEWAINCRGEQCYMQSLADMRIEPRWNPDLAEPSRIKDEFIGRIINVSTHFEYYKKSEKLFSLIYEILAKFQQQPDKYVIPGPLEGTTVPKISLPVKFSELIDSQLRKDQIDPSSFNTLINSIIFFRIEASYAELASKSLKQCNYRLTNIENKLQLINVLIGLATVAAFTRSCLLADELRILVRVYRNDAQYAVTVDDIVRICLISASSRADITEWRDFVGDWLTELAFSKLIDDEGVILHSRLKCLCNIVPELWVSCGRADAALMAYNASNC